MTSLYSDLGINPDATPDEIKKAHRKAVKRTHPDSAGDTDREEFERVQRAYVVLADPAKRARYDETGQVDDQPDNTMSMINEFIRIAFQKALQEAKDRYKNYDMIAHTKRNLAFMRRNAEEEARLTRELMPRKEDLLKRLKVKPGTAFDPIGNMIREELNVLRKQEQAANQGMAGLDAAIAHLEHYGFEFEPMQTPESPSSPFRYLGAYRVDDL